LAPLSAWGPACLLADVIWYESVACDAARFPPPPLPPFDEPDSCVRDSPGTFVRCGAWLLLREKKFVPRLIGPGYGLQAEQMGWLLHLVER
jgi:hypothetical protein